MTSTSPSTSPPRTPIDSRIAEVSRNTATPISDESSIEDLSFDYVLDEKGNLERISKGSSKGSGQYSPPTPPDNHIDNHIERNDFKRPPSPILLNSPVGRSSLARSESAYSVLESISSGPTAERADRPPRSFSRVTSGPLQSSMPSYPASTSLSAGKQRVAPRRGTLDESPEQNGLAGTSRSKQTLNVPSHTHQDEKENYSESEENLYQAPALGKQRLSPALSSRSSSRSHRAAYPSTSGTVQQRVAHARQIAGPRRIMKSASLSSASKPSFERTHDVYGSDNEYGPPPASAPSHHGGRNSPSSISPATGENTESREDEETDPADIPTPNSAISTSFGRQRNHPLLGTAAAVSSIGQPSANRPRRSASFSEALAQDDYQLQVQPPYTGSNSRPGTSLGMNPIAEVPDVQRRATLKEREKQEAEILSDCEKYIREHESEIRGHAKEPQVRQTPSPTHNQNMHQARLAYGHRRQESDTVKSMLPSSTGSPTAVEQLPRAGSRSTYGRVSPPSARNSQGKTSPPGSRLQVRVSPPSKGHISPSGSTAKGRLSPSGRAAAVATKEYVRHRRTTTAPEPPTTSNLVGTGTSVRTSGGKTWAAGEVDEEYQSEREQRAPTATSQQPSPPPPAYSTQPLAQPAAPPASSHPALTQSTVGHAPPPPIQSPRHIVVNKKAYARLDMIGKGGSSRVFRVMNHNNELYAIKRVSLDRTDNEMMAGYMNEIALLKRLEGNSRIIRLIDSEVRAGPGGSKGHLLLVMECGEVDLARLLQDQMKDPLNMIWVAYYWQQMLQAVHVIHEEKIVHSDLKPANFVVVRGQLKLIDFGIANAIANDTTNIQRDHQVGTINYMSPEAIELPDGMRRLKVGRPSDVWSLGVILYQMVYGHPPFQHLPFIQKMRAIPDNNHVIDFPEYSVPTLPASKSPNGDQISPPTKLDHLKQRVRKDVIESIKQCLTRNPKERVTIPEILKHGWLSMKEAELEAPVKPQLADDETIINPYFMGQLLEYGIKRGAAEGQAMDADAIMKEAKRLVAELKSIQP